MKALKSIYYQFENWIATMNPWLFAFIYVILFAIIFISILRFYKIYNGEQKQFEKISLLIITILLFAFVVFITYVRN
ncbi:MAG: hypothetical protein E7374_02135 [Clostridiales bacterium]|nr:hypothetical protein [Clostridiales bacterium]